MRITQSTGIMWTRLLSFCPQETTVRSPPVISGRSSDTIAMKSMNNPARHMPGMTPPMNKRPIEVSVSKPYMIMAMLGGMRMPSVPPAAREPRTIFSLYCCFWNAGNATVPIVAPVATLEPEIDANTAQLAMLVCRSPPGST